MRYEVRVAGHVAPDRLADEVAGLGEYGRVAHESCTVLSGTFADQAALQGFLHRLWARRMHVVDLRRVRGRPR